MLRVRDIMTADVITVDGETTLREAADLLLGRHIGGAPVLEGGRVIGVVSASDLLAALAATAATGGAGDEPDEEAAEELAWDEVGDPGVRWFVDMWRDAEDAGSPEAPAVGRDRAPREPTVAEVMSRHVLAVRPTDPVGTAARAMRTADVHRLLVMERGELRGIVTTSDVARAVADDRVVRRTWVFPVRPGRRMGPWGEARA